MPRVAVLVASLGLVCLSFASEHTPTKRCTYVDDNFVSKPCGNTPTEDQLKQFFATQASQVAQLQSTNPCGFTTCPKMKRDVEFSYSAENKKRQENSYADKGPVKRDGHGNINTLNKSANPKRFLEPEPKPVLDTRSFSHEELLERGIDLDEEELIARNLPTMRTGDGRLVLFGSRSFVPPKPVKRDLVDELHERIRRGEVEPEVEREPVEAMGVHSEVNMP